MNNINTLEDLRNHVGEDVVEQIVTEYLMELTAKGKLLDKVRTVIENGGSTSDIKQLL